VTNCVGLSVCRLLALTKEPAWFRLVRERDDEVVGRHLVNKTTNTHACRARTLREQTAAPHGERGNQLHENDQCLPSFIEIETTIIFP